jgi:SOS response associated peptidase (SRAP)
MGLPTGATERSANHQFPLGETPISGWSVSDSGVAFFRVHRDQIAEAEVEVHEGRRRLVLLRRAVASDAEGGEAFTLLTTAPGPDVAPIHDRQMVVLNRSEWSAWLELVGNEADLLRPLSAGSLCLEQVR